MKSGIKTTEFQIMILTNIGILAAAFEGVLPAKWAAVASAFSSVAYSISRGLSKMGKM